MNRQLALGVLGGFVSGTGVGALVVRVVFEAKLRKRYEEQDEIMKRAYEHALELHMAEKPDQPEEDEQQLELPVAQYRGDDRPVQDVELPEEVVQPDTEQPSVNPYHQAVQATETPVDEFVSGVANAFGISYIEDEDFLDEEDGNFKGRIDIMIDSDQSPIFLMDGNIIDDWAKRVGESILVDFYQLVPPGIDPVLYVRNHRTNEDYEVVLVSQ